MNIKDKNVLITGGIKRVGRGLAEAFAKKGANLILHYNSSYGAAKKLKDRFNKMEVNCHIFQKDFSDTSDLSVFVEEIVKTVGDIDILINSASAFPSDTMMSATEESVTESLKIHSFTPFLLSREIFNRQKEGVVINLLDSKILEYDRSHFSYHIGKRSLRDLTKMMAIEMAPGFRVNGIAPGPLLPPEGESQEYLDKLIENTPLKIRGEIENVSDTALFLAENSFITGQIIYVDGGYHLKRRVYG